MMIRYSFRLPAWLLVAGAGLVICVACAPMAGQEQRSAPSSIAPPDAKSLRPVSAFKGISDRKQRSVAIFVEAGRVLQSPRCLNCHPVERIPTQGEDLHLHVPFVSGGEGDHGVPGLTCNSCHGANNVTTLSTPVQTIPGNPRWALAPASMAWQGKTLAEICVQIKDPVRNGGHTLQQIHKHMAEDPLVGWAWQPGAGREPAPGTQEELGHLLTAWIDTGAACPDG